MSATQIRDAALKLTPEERARLAEDLLTSLDQPVNAAVDEGLSEEVERRIDSLDAGKTSAIPAEDVFRELQDRRR